MSRLGLGLFLLLGSPAGPPAGGSTGVPGLAAPGPLSVRGAPWSPGDLVLRRGRGALSRAVLAADPSMRFSHIGLVVSEGGEPWVIHAAPGPPTPSSPSPVRLEPLRRFLAPDRASAAALYRIDGPLASAIPIALSTARSWVDSALPFDAAFDLATDDALYCSELIWKAYLSAGVDLVAEAPRPWRLIPAGPDVLLPGRMVAGPHVRLVHTFDSE
ncbi:MAG: YiiX/YebB-like N1pC/P60 family cysteine hydrolase [Acidobacteriota bacterium]